jgi:GxxExxY protein
MFQQERREPEERLDQLAHAVIGAAIEVHRQLGPGYLEEVYQGALELELKLQGIPFEAQKPVSVSYKGHPVGEGRLDFLVDEILVVELKAVESLADIHKAQVISYLKATKLHLGLLINFNVTTLKNGLKRVILSPQQDK